MAIESIQDMRDYLHVHNIHFSQLEELTGGTANWVFRLTKSDGGTVIIKHAESHVRSNAQIAFPVERMNFEASALQDISSHLPRDDLVNPAELHDYDAQAHVLTISDGGHRTLKEAYTDPSLDVASVGTQLGTWLASLHANTKSVDIGDNQVAKSIYQHSYRNLHRSFAKFGYDITVAEKVAQDFAPLLLTDDASVCHGDFWPGNVLISDDTDSKNTKLTIVDWEMTRRGIGATDVAQFAAESLLLDRFRGGRGLLDAFLRGYLDAAGGKEKLDARWKQRFAVHCGTHLGYWPSIVPWGNEVQTKEVVGLGRDIIVAGLSMDWALLRATPLSALF